MIFEPSSSLDFCPSVLWVISDVLYEDSDFSISIFTRPTGSYTRITVVAQMIDFEGVADSRIWLIKLDRDLGRRVA